MTRNFRNPATERYRGFRRCAVNRRVRARISGSVRRRGLASLFTRSPSMFTEPMVERNPETSPARRQSVGKSVAGLDGVLRKPKEEHRT
ncbi:hypothetical protein CULT_300035 [[Clostridium] ultunense Esp]|nr:hypothetical protein CULT_300035 [[Clostridium] ultunense Esp]